jgi:PKHD-type hydroxylase
MRLVIANVLSNEELETVRTTLANAQFVDGRATAGFAAGEVKNNLQAAGADRSLDTVRQLISERLLGHDLFRMAVRPKTLSRLLFSRYEPGMSYGRHLDDAIMQGMRVDVAFTLFLSDPERYAGGDLVIDSTDGEDNYRLAAGSLVVYPATSMHCVADVTQGVRLAAVGWARSFIRDPARRELLFDLDTARRALFTREQQSNEFELVAKSFANLMRMWAED